MAIGINDIDYDDELNDNATTQDIDQQEDIQETTETDVELDDRGILQEFLNSRGIEDISKIKYEGEDGEEEEVDWDSLDSKEKLSILNSLSNEEYENDLDDSEIQLINSIRSSRMSPTEYINYAVQTGADQYARSMQQGMDIYEIDQFSDDDLFVTDFITRMGRDNVTDEEISEALEKAKSNEELFNKQIKAIRTEYKNLEDQNRQYNAYLAQQERQEQYNQFASTIRDQVLNFDEFGGFDLNMDQDDKEELYEFITGFDEAGNSILGKAIEDPAILTRMSWFALHGEQMLDDIQDYVRQQIAKARKDSYTKGVEDARAGRVKDTNKKVVTAYKPKSNTSHMSIDDLD